MTNIELLEEQARQRSLPEYLRNSLLAQIETLKLQEKAAKFDEAMRKHETQTRKKQ
jgi:hypothetical protein